MLIRVASDLHLEFFRHPVEELERHFLPADPHDARAVLVLAGDISSDIDQLAEFLARAAARFVKVFYVPGNHEYYRADMDAWDAAVAARLSTVEGLRFALGAPAVFEHDGVLFIIATLWGDGGETAEEQASIGHYLNDFRLISYRAGRFTVAAMRRLHEAHRQYIDGALSTAPTVVVTHHMPSYTLSHPRFGNIATGGFAGKCDALMEGDTAPRLWIHGHTHDTIDRQIGRTRVVCNPAGYYPEWGTAFNQFFAAPKFVEVEGKPCE